jgi:hypothetical protein
MTHDDWMASRAKDYITATLGVHVEDCDREGRQGVYDLRYTQHGRTAAVEVKAVVDPTLRKMDAAINRAGYIAEPRLRRLWVVHLEHGAHIGVARAQLPALLVEFEQRRWLDHAALTVARTAGFGPQLGELKLRSMWSQPPTADHPPGFALLPEGRWTWEGQVPDPAEFVTDLLSDENSRLVRDLVRQLGAARDVAERHAFLLLGWEYPSAWPLLTPGGNLPTEAPQLPEPIDGLWLATFSPDTRVIAWLPERGWIEGRQPE